MIKVKFMWRYHPVQRVHRNVGFGIQILIALVFCTGGLRAQNCAPVPPGLVGWWKADGNPTDAVGTNNGTLIGDTGYSAGVVGQAYRFDGYLDGVRVGKPAALQLQTFTIESWIKRSDAAKASLDAYGGGAIFGYGYGGYQISLLDNGRLALTKNGESFVGSVRNVADTNWHHVAVSKS